MSYAPRSLLIRQAWKASAAGRFSEKALLAAAADLAGEAHRPKLLQALPSVWKRLDDEGSPADWLVATGLDAEAIDALNAAIGAGLPPPGKKSGLHAYSLRPQDFGPLLFLVLVAARLTTPYVAGGPHQGIRAQFWYAPELVIIVARCLPPKLDMMAAEHAFRYIMQAPQALWDDGEAAGWDRLAYPGLPHARPHRNPRPERR
jgi:hypothetical protein